MAKSKRSTVKMAYKAMRRSVMQPKFDAQLREQAGKVYKAIGLPMPEERKESEQMAPRTHGGSEIVTTFTPTPEGPVLNVVHGPNAQSSRLRLKPDVIGFPLDQAGAQARMRAELPHSTLMQLDDEYELYQNRPYFYNRRQGKKSRGISKKERRDKRKTKKLLTKKKTA